MLRISSSHVVILGQEDCRINAVKKRYRRTLLVHHNASIEFSHNVAPVFHDISSLWQAQVLHKLFVAKTVRFAPPQESLCGLMAFFPREELDNQLFSEG